MRLLVTGYTGFIGRNLLEGLDRHEFEVIGLARSSVGDQSVHNIALDLLEIDESKLDGLARSIQSVEAVVHLAAYKPVVRSNKPDSFFENMSVNVGGTINLLRIADRLKAKKIIYSSSTSVYGHQGKMTLKEEDVPLPDTNYGRSKLLAERVIGDFAEAHGVECISLRISSVFGPGMPCSLVFADFMERALRGAPLIVYEHETGFEKLNLVYVKDVLTALMCAIRKTGHQKAHEVFNIGGDSQVNTFELATQITQAAVSASKIRVVKTEEAKRPSGLSNVKAMGGLGWRPKFDMKTALKDLLPMWRCENYSPG